MESLHRRKIIPEESPEYFTTSEGETATADDNNEERTVERRLRERQDITYFSNTQSEGSDSNTENESKYSLVSSTSCSSDSYQSESSHGNTSPTTSLSSEGSVNCASDECEPKNLELEEKAIRLWDRVKRCSTKHLSDTHERSLMDTLALVFTSSCKVLPNVKHNTVHMSSRLIQSRVQKVDLKNLMILSFAIRISRYRGSSRHMSIAKSMGYVGITKVLKIRPAYILECPCHDKVLYRHRRPNTRQLRAIQGTTCAHICVRRN